MPSATFGPWTPHIQLTEMCQWYILPAELEQELSEYTFRPEDAVAMPAKQFKHLMSELREYADASVQGWKLPFHHPGHFEKVRRHGCMLFDAYHGDEAHTTYLFVRQAWEMALYSHDCHHCGSTLRIDHQLPLHLPELGKEVSVEYVTALAVNTFLRDRGVPLPWRLFILGVHWASTFGHGPAVDRGLTYIPNVQPTTLYHAKIRVADAQIEEEVDAYLDNAIRVAFGEISAAGTSITDIGEFLESQRGFLNYLSQAHDRLDAIAGKPLTEITGFRERVATYIADLEPLIRGEDPATMRRIELLANRYRE